MDYHLRHVTLPWNVCNAVKEACQELNESASCNHVRQSCTNIFLVDVISKVSKNCKYSVFGKATLSFCLNLAF